VSRERSCLIANGQTIHFTSKGEALWGLLSFAQYNDVSDCQETRIDCCEAVTQLALPPCFLVRIPYLVEQNEFRGRIVPFIDDAQRVNHKAWGALSLGKAQIASHSFGKEAIFVQIGIKVLIIALGNNREATGAFRGILNDTNGSDWTVIR